VSAVVVDFNDARSRRAVAEAARRWTMPSNDSEAVEAALGWPLLSAGERDFLDRVPCRCRLGREERRRLAGIIRNIMATIEAAS
jgi:hypothetical protein